MSTPSLADIESRISSDDPEVLGRCLGFIDDRLKREADRARSAETRGTAMLALIGAGVAFLVHASDKLPSSGDGSADVTLPVVLYVATILFLAKSAYYAIRTLAVLKYFRLKADSVYEMEPLSEAGALRKELAGKIWEYEMSVSPNTSRLYTLQRCQRNLVLSFASLMLVGSALLPPASLLAESQGCSSFVAGALSLLILICGDPIVERLGMWKPDSAV